MVSRRGSLPDAFIADNQPTDGLPSVSAVAELAQRAAKRGFAARFKPGQSGNPSGQSGFYHRCVRFARF